MTSKPLRIISIEVYQSRIKLKEPFVISLEKLDYAENIMVAIHTNLGISGFGECSPFKTINGESMQTAWVVADNLAPLLLNKDPLRIGDRMVDMNRMIYGNSSIKSAFDIALYDIASQQACLPLHAFLGGNSNKKMFTDYTVSLSNHEKMAQDALAIKRSGFRFIKVKLGDSGKKDIERIVAIRKAIGGAIPLRIDANQGWDYETAVFTLRSLAEFNIQYCEEPIARWDFLNLASLRKRSPIPIMADESCGDHHDAKRLIDLKSVDYLNIKLGKSSGIFNARKMIRLAEDAGMNMQVGGFLESRLGFTASAHLALSSGYIHFFDFDTPLMFEEDPMETGIVYGPGGEIIMPETEGLGAKPKESFLKRLVKKTFSC